MDTLISLIFRHGVAKGSTEPRSSTRDVGKRGEKQERRSFSAEFKLEAAQLMRSRRAQGVTLEQIGRELEVPPDQLRAWSRQADKRAGAKPPDVFPGNGNLPSAEEEIRRLRRELEATRQERDFLKSDDVLREGVAVKYVCIARHRGEFQVRLMCRVLEVSESGFYASEVRQRRAPSIRSTTDQRLTLHVRALHKKSSRRYGAPRIHEDLMEAGIRCGGKRVARTGSDARERVQGEACTPILRDDQV
ncbi:MAG: transposase [Gemmatimonadaceae bacterium]